MALKLSELRTSLQNLNDDISDVGSSVFVEWVNFLTDYLWAKLQNIDPEQFIESQSFSVSSSPSSQSLPASFRHMRVLNTGIFEKDGNGNPTERRLPMTNYGSSLRGYWIKGNTVNFTSINSSESFEMRYLPKRTRFTSASDYFTVNGLIGGAEIVPEDSIETIIKGLDTLHKQWDNDPGMESVADQRFIRTMAPLFENFRTGPAVYSPSQSTNAF